MFFESVKTLFDQVVNYGILVLEIVGALVILYFSGKSIWYMFRREHARSRAAMTAGITTALNLLLGSEVLKTIIAPGWTDIGMTCAILVMRAGVTFLLIWEGKHEPPAD